MLTLVIAAALSQAASQAAPAPHWRLVHRAEGSEAFVDPASLRRDGGRFEIDVRFIFARVQPNGVKSMIARHRYTCARQSVMVLDRRTFDVRGATLRHGRPDGPMARDLPAGGRSAHAAILRGWCPARGRT